MQNLNARSWRALLHLSGLLFALLLAPPALADEYDDLRARWLAQLTGGPGLDTSDPDIAARLLVINDTAQGYWSTLRKDAGRPALWDDLYPWVDSGDTITAHYNRLKSMALAYATPGTALYGNAALAADIVGGLDWLYANKYNLSTPVASNLTWWNAEIGSPIALDDIMVLMYGQLSATQRANWIAVIDRFVPDPSLREGNAAAVETGANLLDKVLVVALRGVLGKSSAKIAQARDEMAPAFPYVTGGDGFYADGSLVQHSRVAYVGSYGAILLSDATALFYLLNGSSWAFSDPNAANVYRWATETFQPFMYNGAQFDAVRGRALARHNSTDHTAGRGIVANFARLAKGAPADKAALLNGIAKGWMQRDTSFANYFDSVGLADIVNLKAIAADSGVVAAPEPVDTHMFAGMDRPLHRAAGFVFGLGLSSPRIQAFEYGNGENTRGWWTGLGMTYLYNADQTQYSDGYWPTVNSYRLPGTTTDGSSGTLVNFKYYPNTQTWVGGATVGANGAFGMQFDTVQVTGTALKGKKSWFTVGDRIVALGSNIATTDGRAVETIVDNRKLNAAGDNALTVNGSAKSSSVGWSESMAGVQWAHLAGNVAGSDIGYFFPGTASIDGLRESRSGYWSDINTLNYPLGNPQQTNRFLSLAFKHGTNPTAGSYAYVILPNRTAAQTAAYAAAPTVKVMENSADAHAILDTSGGVKVVGVNFWNDASKTVYDNGYRYVSSNRKAAVSFVEANGELEVGVADPTQLNTGSIQVEIFRVAGEALSVDPGVTVDQLTPTIKLTIAVNASAGKTFRARFKLAKLAYLTVAADAYVRSGSYANTNFGSTAVSEVKKEAAGYDRQTLLRFDLSSIVGTIVNAKVRLSPIYKGTASGIVHQAYLVPTDSWGETTVSWNNKPATSTLLASWTVPDLNAWTEFDATAAVQAAAGSDELVSFLIDSAANYGGEGWVQYPAREHTVTTKPTLAVTYY
ncbi:polysaccharide lyase family 8 super-sandwich domain-containing protein [Chitinimonas koreensis]|uniref:polysaccharide lyase family 8 super-sandwich domain-containing protein n=1 Tax=Chitinimonas koreensis TaxID=356302 RepID=UPI00040B3ED8|nr:polysaccharide lyase family 8 super-sandwich domain-containing protein [Chitinimonas koreensis]QNM98796.1 polysaccharide lyase 8 family protein [Chitinimonas koreensis]